MATTSGIISNKTTTPLYIEPRDIRTPAHRRTYMHAVAPARNHLLTRGSVSILQGFT